ncbi:MAG: hypothetical protein ACSLFR_13005 [Solirubrobacteraceae bacterium]
MSSTIAAAPLVDELTVSVTESEACLIRDTLSLTGGIPDEAAFAKLTEIRRILHAIGWRDGVGIDWPVDLTMSRDLWLQVIGDQLHLAGGSAEAALPLVEGCHVLTPRAVQGPVCLRPPRDGPEVRREGGRGRPRSHGGRRLMMRAPTPAELLVLFVVLAILLAGVGR